MRSTAELEASRQLARLASRISADSNMKRIYDLVTGEEDLSTEDERDFAWLLAEFFQKRSERNAGLSPRPLAGASRRALLAYHWPGNVRELENLMERAVLLSRGDEVCVKELGQDPVTVPPSDTAAFRGLSLEEVERRIIQDTLQRFEGHQKKTAESLGIGVRTLRDKIKKWDLKVERKEALTS